MAKTATALKTYTKFEAPKPIRRKLSLPTGGGKMTNYWVDVVHDEDPKDALIKRLGPLPGEVVQLTKILVAVYQPPMVTKTAGGVILTDKLKESDVEEYLWQGKVGLIVAMGAQAYEDDDTTKFHGVRNKVGDWVWFRPSDGMGCIVNEVFCRVLREGDIIGRIPHPDAIW